MNALDPASTAGTPGIEPGPDLYRRNAFRVSGLPVDAPARRVRRRAGEIEAARSLGGDWHRPPSLLAGPDPDPDDVLDALRRLRDPARRLAEEFFWLWPLGDGDLGGTDLAEARRTWRHAIDGVPADRPAALHNEAVAKHLGLLEGSLGGGSFDARWAAAYRTWRRVIDEDGCWAWLRDRATALDDPRVGPSDADALRRALPDILLATHARVALAAVGATGADHGRAAAHVAAIRASGFPAATVEAALGGAVAPHTARFRGLVERSQSSEDHTAAIAELLDARADLAVVREILGPGHDRAIAWAGELAECLRTHIVTAANARLRDAPANGVGFDTGPIEEDVDLLLAAAELAADGIARERIERDATTLLTSIIMSDCNTEAVRGEADPDSGLRRHVGLWSRSRRRLRRLRGLNADAHDDIRDGVVATSLTLLFSYAAATGDRDTALYEVRKLRPLAMGSDVRSELNAAVRLLEGGNVPTPARPARPAAHRVVTGRCAFCDRPARDQRLIRMVSGEPYEGTPAAPVAIRCCDRCIRLPIGGAGAGCLQFLALLGGVFALIVALAGPATYADVAVYFYSALAAIFVLSLLARPRRRRLRLVLAHPEVRRRLEAGDRIAA